MAAILFLIIGPEIGDHYLFSGESIKSTNDRFAYAKNALWSLSPASNLIWKFKFVELHQCSYHSHLSLFFLAAGLQIMKKSSKVPTSKRQTCWRPFQQHSHIACQSPLQYFRQSPCLFTDKVLVPRWDQPNRLRVKKELKEGLETSSTICVFVYPYWHCLRIYCGV